MRGQRKLKFGKVKSSPSSARIILSLQWESIKFVNMTCPPRNSFRLLKILVCFGSASQITFFNSWIKVNLVLLTKNGEVYEQTAKIKKKQP